MKAVRIVQGTAVPLDRTDVDTDQIIPSDWLKRVEHTKDQSIRWDEHGDSDNDDLRLCPRLE